MSIDFRKFYDLESYLFDEVGPRFAMTGELAPADLYLIFIWKAERAKTRLRDKLAGDGAFGDAAAQIGADLREAVSDREKLEIIMSKWGLRLATSSAVLTVLYPTSFTVYDRRLCEQLKAFEELADRQFSEDLWEAYREFVAAVEFAAPNGLSLREKDKWLWGKSRHDGVVADLGL